MLPIEHEHDASLAPVIEAIEHGRDGYPRWIVAAVPRPHALARTTEAVAAAATSRGLVAISVDAYLRARIVGAPELDERTLLLVDSGADPPRAHAALLRASAQSPRPHLLLTLRTVPGGREQGLVREARAAYAADRAERDSPQVVDLLSRASRAEQFVSRGRHAAAGRLLREVAAALARRGAGAHAARVTIRLGRMFIERGQVKAAFDTFEESIGLAQSARPGDIAVEGRLWQATARIAGAALVEAEALCRAALESRTLAGELTTWAHAVLGETLLWQGRANDVPEFDGEALVAFDPIMAGGAYDVRVRALLAQGRSFEAGQCVERLKTLARDTNDPTVRVIAHLADLRLLAATGDLVRAADAFHGALAASRAAKTPVRAAWARVLWLDTLRRAHQDAAVAPELDRLQQMSRVAPPLLQREIARRVSCQAPQPLHAVPVRQQRPSSLAIALLRMAHEDDDENTAIRAVLARVAHELQTSRVDVLSCAAGPASVICSLGEGLPTRLGARVLEAAFAIGPERQAGGWETGVPVRVGTRTIGAIVCRWPIDRAAPDDAVELLDLTAVIAAPRLDAVHAARREEARAATAVPELLGASEAIADVRKAIVRAAAAPFNILIEGESGVGKELAARAIHQLSPRRERRFCDLNCAALPEELLESELFGHARGAFSGAVVDRAGLFEDANGGTLFLDEVADLSARAQAKLLRAIQQQEVRRVGESFSRKVDVRIVAAANRDMRAEAASGRFRHDLLYRVDVVRIQMPPLRERPADIRLLAEHCWTAATARTGSHARLSPATVSELARYHWPGNVRELQNVMAALAVAAPPRGWVRPSLLPPVVSTAGSVSSGRLVEAREQFERRFVEVALARAGGNRARAARSLGLSRQGLLKTMTRLKLSSLDREGLVI
jgi:DNA-binding NtrC family response regulator